MKDQKYGYAIYSGRGDGPTFGGGYDLYVSDNAASNTKSYTSIGSGYQLPSGVTTSKPHHHLHRNDVLHPIRSRSVLSCVELISICTVYVSVLFHCYFSTSNLILNPNQTTCKPSQILNFET